MPILEISSLHFLWIYPASIVIGIFQEMLTRHITGLNTVNLDDYDKEILSGIELKIKLNPKLVEAGD